MHQQHPSVHMITKSLTTHHLKGFNPAVDGFHAGDQVNVPRSTGDVDYDWVVVELVGDLVVVSKLIKENIGRAS